MDMTEYLMSVAMYSIKYAEAFNYNEEEVSSTLGYIFKFYQDKTKKYSTQELSLLTVLLTKEKKEDFDKLLNVYTLDNIKLLIENAKDIKDTLTLANKVKELYYKKSFDVKKEDIEKIFKKRK